MSLPPAERIPLPAVPPTPPRPGVPVVAMVAPLGLAVVLWLATGSPYALLVGLLAPLMAVGSMLDGRRTARRGRRRAIAEAREQLARLETDALARRDERAVRMRRLAPGLDELVLAPGGRGLRVGTGAVPSGVELTGEAPAELADEVARLREECGVVDDAPIVVDAERFAVRGADPLVRAFARGVVLQAVARRPVGSVRVEVPHGEDWASTLPASVVEGDRWRVTSGDETVLELDGGLEGVGATLVEFPSDGADPRLDGVDGRWRPDLVSRPEAAHVAARLAEAARAAGWRASGDLPREVDLARLLSDPVETCASAACLGVDDRGAVSVDLERDGPHALVAGTTGSGKSELLVTWVVALAARRPPSEVAFLLVDFKGGASFEPLRGLPHVVGVVSDLDEALAARAVQSLRAELRRREAELAGHGVRDIAELPPGALPRLYVVVDEFAALLAADTELHAVFADLAARGRSLGMHLLLGTQRPSGVVRDALLANVTVRVCLRVLDAAESSAMVGVPDAAGFDGDARGRAMLADVVGRRVVQIARASPRLVGEVAVRWRDAPVPTARPWVDPLPPRLGIDELPSGALGLVDRPEHQRRDPLALDPWRDGAVLVLGGAASGRTNALAVLAVVARAHHDAEVRWVAGDAAELWQALTLPAARRVLVLADDLDATLAHGDAEQRADLAELVALLAREGGRRGLAIAASARTAGGALSQATASFEQRILLRMPTREDHLLAGGEARGHRADRRPGSCLWRGHEAQLALAPRAVEPWRAPLPVATPGGAGWGVVTPRPDAWLARLAAAGVTAESVDRPDADPSAVLVGDPEGWLAAHGALTRIRRAGRLLLHGCGRADHRMLTRSRDGVPPLGAPDEAWLVEGATTRRVRIRPPAGA